MAPSIDQVMEMCQVLSQQHELKVTINQSLKGSLWTFGGAFIGGLLGGRMGLALGGAAGTIVGTTAVKNFRSVVDVLKEIDLDQKEELYIG